MWSACWGVRTFCEERFCEERFCGGRVGPSVYNTMMLEADSKMPRMERRRQVYQREGARKYEGGREGQVKALITAEARTVHCFYG